MEFDYPFKKFLKVLFKTLKSETFWAILTISTFITGIALLAIYLIP